MGHSEILFSFTNHIRGNELAVPCIGNILDVLNLRAADGATPDFFDIRQSKDSMQEWFNYRTKLLSKEN